MARHCSTLVRGRSRIMWAPAVPPALAGRWLTRWRDAFGPARRPAPGMPSKPDIALESCALGEVVLKREHAGGARGLGLRETRAARAFALGRAMVEEGVPTPEPLAVVVERTGPATRCACLFTRFIDGVGPWAHFARGEDEARALLRALGSSVAALHGAGFRHRDLKAPNLLVEDGGAEAEARVWILDLDGAARCLPTPGRVTTLRDLARLGASFGSTTALEAGVEPAHWTELVRHYLEARQARVPTEDEMDALLAETIVRAQRKIARNRRVDRPLA